MAFLATLEHNVSKHTRKQYTFLNTRTQRHFHSHKKNTHSKVAHKHRTNIHTHHIHTQAYLIQTDESTHFTRTHLHTLARAHTHTRTKTLSYIRTNKHTRTHIYTKHCHTYAYIHKRTRKYTLHVSLTNPGLLTTYTLFQVFLYILSSISEGLQALGGNLNYLTGKQRLTEQGWL